MTILKTVNLTLEMNGRLILNDLNLSVEAGTVHAVLGPNAAGKSSLAYAVVGCCDYFPQKGNIFFTGTDITSKSIVDCVEIVQGNAKAKAIPIVDVTEEKAIDIVVGGLLK